MTDDQPECFVPGCKNEVGILFPKNEEIKNLWLKSLNLELLNATSNSFICLDHFEEDANGHPSIIPSIRTSKSTQNNAPQSLRQHLRRSLRRVGAHSNQALKREIGKPEFRTYQRIRKKVKGNAQTTGSKRDKDDLEVHIDLNHVCRLCMIQSVSPMESVFNKVNNKHTIADMIRTCLYPLKVLPTDKFSKKACPTCVDTLKDYFTFYQLCIAMDSKQKELMQIKEQLKCDGNYDSEFSDEYLHEERLSDYEKNKENQVKTKTKTETSNQEILNNGLNKSEIDKKFDKVEEELLKVLEGEGHKRIVKELPESITLVSKSKNNKQENATIKDEDIYTEDIIIEMVNDEETPSPLLSDLNLPLTIKRVQPESPKSKSPKRIRKKSETDSQNVTMITNANTEEVVVLPSSIKVEVKKTFSSPLGIFSCEPVKYVLNSEFLLDDNGYLYNYKLTKKSIRYLECAAHKCPAKAVQEKLENSTFSKELEVKTPHNHVIPDSKERKKQMFFSIMYSRMRKEQNFNFKQLHDLICGLDPEIASLLPLRQIIKIISSQGPITRPRPLKDFHEFFNLVENEEFSKLHFTDHNVQFYQDKFESGDGAKAVVFANREVISEYSNSDIMFVDASFHIDPDTFPYQLVTVLVWNGDLYYPIMWAFVNQKSQDLYNKIFESLRNDLGPQLRPREIITEYEANLYYALAETYVESTIGGAVFYFTQNLYKKICALNLSKQLEVNTNFRTVYNMLQMLPLLPVDTIVDGLDSIKAYSKELGVSGLADDLFQYVFEEWICKVTPELFSVHNMESRINESVTLPFKKLRDKIMLVRLKQLKGAQTYSVTYVTEKLIELEKMFRESQRPLVRKDSTSSHRRLVYKVWKYIEDHPSINIRQFYMRVLGYIKCLENQLWIWGFYRYTGDSDDYLINAANFSIVDEALQDQQEYIEDTPMEEDFEATANEEDSQYFLEDGEAAVETNNYSEAHTSLEEMESQDDNTKNAPALVMEAVIDENGQIVLQNSSSVS